MASLGLTIPVESILDVAQFRHDFLYGLVLGQSVTDKDFIAAWSKWTVPTETLPCPKTQQQAMELLNLALWGNVPDSTVLEHLRMQLSRLETQLGITMEIRQIAMEPIDGSSGQYDEIRPRLPWVGTNRINGAMRVEVPGPIIAVQRVRAVDAEGSVIREVDLNLVRIADKRMGIIEFVDPTGSGFPYRSPTSVVSGGASNLFGSALRLTAVDTYPGFWAVDYLTGPVTNGRAGEVPAAVKFQVWAQVAVFLLALHSNVTTKGVSSQSRNVDGISNSVNLTNTAMYDVNSALEIILNKYGDLVSPGMLARRMRGIPCAAF